MRATTSRSDRWTRAFGEFVGETAAYALVAVVFQASLRGFDVQVDYWSACGLLLSAGFVAKAGRS